MLTLAALAFVFTALSEEGSGKKGPSKEMLKKYDTNEYGVISDAEKEAGKMAAKAGREGRRAEELEKYDENKDSKINKDERAKIKAARAAEETVHKAERDAKKAERRAMKESK